MLSSKSATFSASHLSASWSPVLLCVGKSHTQSLGGLHSSQRLAGSGGLDPKARLFIESFEFVEFPSAVLEALDSSAAVESGKCNHISEPTTTCLALRFSTSVIGR